MSRLAHATYGAPHFKAEKRDLAKQVQREAIEAARLMKEHGISRTEALRIAHRQNKETT